MDEESKEGDWDYQERRAEARKKITLKRTFPAEIELDTPKGTYIYVSDVSPGGMKIITDLTLPDNRAFTLRILLRDPIEISVEVVWQRKLLGYMNAIGLQFVELSPEIESKLEHLMTRFEIDTSKRIFRLNKMLNCQVFREGEWMTFYAYVVNLNPQGFEFTTDYDLPRDEMFPLRAFIIPGELPVEAEAKILFQKEISMGRTKGWLEFGNIDEKNKIRLVEYIDKLLQGELPEKIRAPIENFEMPEFKEQGASAELQSSDERAIMKKLVEETIEADADDGEWRP